MCPQGNVCAGCGGKATIELHWPAWVLKVCETCGPKFADGRIMKFYNLKEETNEKPRVN